MAFIAWQNFTDQDAKRNIKNDSCILGENDRCNIVDRSCEVSDIIITKGYLCVCEQEKYGIKMEQLNPKNGFAKKRSKIVTGQNTKNL